MEIIKSQMGGRESVFLPFKKDENGKLKSTPPIRWLMANYVMMLKKHFDRYNFLDEPMNLYHSLATYTQMPMFSYSWRVKSQQQAIWLKEFKNYIKACDLFVETDSPDLSKSIPDGIDIKKFFDKYIVKYSVSFSGSKGLHFIVPSQEFDWLTWKTFDEEIERNVGDFDKFMLNLPVDEKSGAKILDKVLLFKAISLRLKTLLSCSTIDTSVNDIKRIRKTPYSVDCKSGRIALPLTDEQLKYFDVQMCNPENVLKEGVYMRGLLWRNTHFPLSERHTSMKQMLVDLGILKT